MRTDLAVPAQQYLSGERCRTMAPSHSFCCCCFPPQRGGEAIQQSDPFFISRAAPLAQRSGAVTRCHPPFVPIFEEPPLCLLGVTFLNVPFLCSLSHIPIIPIPHNIFPLP